MSHGTYRGEGLDGCGCIQGPVTTEMMMMMMMDQIHETYRGGEHGGCGRILGQCKGPILTEMMTVMTMMMTVMMTDQFNIFKAGFSVDGDDGPGHHPKARS